MQTTPIYQRAVTPTATDVGFTDGGLVSRVGTMGNNNSSSSSYSSSSGGSGNSGSSGLGVAGLGIATSSSGSSSSSSGIVRGKVLQYNQHGSMGQHRQRSEALLQPIAGPDENIQPVLQRSSSAPKAAFVAVEDVTHADDERGEMSDASVDRLKSHGLPQAQPTPKAGGPMREPFAKPPHAGASSGSGSGSGSGSDSGSGSGSGCGSGSGSGSGRGIIGDSDGDFINDHALSIASVASKSTTEISGGGGGGSISAATAVVNAHAVRHNTFGTEGGKATIGATASRAGEEAKFHQAFDAWMKKTILDTIESARLSEQQRGK